MGRPLKIPGHKKRSYYLAPKLLELFDTATFGNVSDGANGSVVLWLALGDMPTVREAAIAASRQSDVNAGIRRVRATLVEEIMSQEVWTALAKMTPGEKLDALSKLHKGK